MTHYLSNFRFYRSAGILSLSLMILLFSQAIGAQTIAPEDVVPASSSSFVLINNVPEIAKTINDSTAWQEILEELKQEIDKEPGEMQDTKKFIAANIWDIIAMSTSRIAGAHVKPMDMDQFSLIIDFGSITAVLEASQKILNLLGEEGKENIVPNAGTYLDVSYGIVKPDGRFAFLNNLFVYTPDQESLEAIINVYTKKEPSMADDPKFNMAVSKISSEGEVLIYANPELSNPITQALTRSEPLKLLGTGDVKASAMKINLLSPTRDIDIYMYSGYSESVMASMFSQSVPLLSPHIIPAKNADFFYAFNTGNFVSIWEKLMSNTEKEMSEDEYLGMQNAISQFETGKGINIKNDILDSLTGEVGVAFGMPDSIGNEGGADSLVQRGIMIFLGVRDRDKINMSIDRLLSDQPMEQTQYKGVDIRYIKALNTPEGPMGYMFADNLIVLSNMKRLMAVIDEENPLASSENFAKLGTRLSEPSNGLFFVNLEGIVSRIPVPDNQLSKTLFLQDMGIIGGSMSFDGEGFRTKITGNQAKSWLDIAGNLVSMSIRSEMKD